MAKILRTRLAQITVAVAVFIAGIIIAAPPAQAATLTPISGFGDNPGNLNMHTYIPDTVGDNPPVVVALHGCAQSASDYHANSGWSKYADQWGFIVIYAEQTTANNFSRCFNWFEPGDYKRGGGEAVSIVSMVNYAIGTYDADASNVYVTGLSGGAAMSASMLASYPEVFAGGSVIAGMPYACATSMINAFTCMNPGVNKTPEQWGELVRAAHPGFDGTRPKVAIWHGTSDYTVATANATESVEQWTNVAAISSTPTETVSLPANTTLEKFGNDDVRRYLVSGMGHGTPVDPGTADEQCGQAAAYFLDSICSTYYDAVFFGLNR